jgi:enoyl-CoA hydratase/carnithine racemase
MVVDTIWPMPQDDILFETADDGAVLHVILNRPAKRNALTPTMARRIREELQGLAPHVHLAVFRSAAPGVFCAGFDIGHLPGEATAEDPATPLYELFAFLETCPVLTVAFADGLVVGGGVELFVCCDLRLTTLQSTFRMPPARLSIVYEREGLERFVRRAGLTAATEMFLAGRAYTAGEAQQCGLATRIVSADELHPYCDDVRQGAPLARKARKEVLRSASRSAPPLENELERFAVLKQSVLASADHQEAIAAFREKRPPRFTGR